MSERVGVLCPHCDELAVYVTLDRVSEGDPSIPYGRHYYWEPDEVEVACGCSLDDDELEHAFDRALAEAPYPR